MRIIRSLVVSLLGAAFLGCGNESFPKSRDLSEFEPLPQFDEVDLARLIPVEPIDYIELRRSYPDLDEPDTVENSAGDKCVHATDIPACVAEFDALSSDSGFDEPTALLSHSSGDMYYLRNYRYLAINRGDENGVVSSKVGLLAFLGLLDSTEELVLFLTAEGYAWNTDSVANGGVRSVENGYEVLVYTGSVCSDVSHKLLLVEPSGDIGLLETSIVKRNEPCAAAD